jgi:ferredoxin
MATIKTETAEEQLENGSSIKEACEALGVPFGCRSGFCTACKVEILEGAENLSPKEAQEASHNLPDNERLACQVKIKEGTVKIKL